MLARITILVAFFSFLNDASAQFMNTFGNGSPLGSLMAQQCPYNIQPAPQLQMSPEQQRIEAMREGERFERERLAAVDRDLGPINADIRKLEAGIRRRLTPEAARIVIKFMRDGGEGPDLAECGAAPVRRHWRRVDPGPMDTITAPPPQGVPLDQQQQDVPVQDPQSTSDNRAIDDSRMPAADQNGAPGAPGPTADTPAAATTAGATTPTAPVVGAANAPNPAADPKLVKPEEKAKAASTPTVQAPVVSESDAKAPPAPPAEAEVYDLPTDHYSRGGVFCVHGRNMWDQYIQDGEVSPSICEQMIGFDRTHLANIQRAGRTGESVAACQDALDRLPALYRRWKPLDEQHATYLGNADQYRVEADPTYGVRNRSPRISTGLQGNIHAFVAPLSRVEQIPGVNFSGGWPYRSPSFFSNNYGAGGYNGFANQPYNGYYGAGPGGFSQGGYGCNGTQNPLFQNPWGNSMPPWMNGAGQWGPPQVPQYRPMPNMAGLGQPRYAPFPYGNAQGVPGMPRYAPMPGVQNIGAGGIVPGQLPLGGTLGGQLGALGAGLGGWGAGAGGISNLVSGSYYGATVPLGYGGYQTSYLNTPSLGAVPSRLPYAP